MNPANRTRFTEADGRQLAIDMIRAIGQRWQEQEFPDLQDGDGDKVIETLINAEPEILRQHLATLRDSNDSALERGFLCLLSEFIGSAASDGVVPDLEGYETHETKRVLRGL